MCGSSQGTWQGKGGGPWLAWFAPSAQATTFRLGDLHLCSQQDRLQHDLTIIL